MAKTPDALIEQIMQMTGMSRSEAEKKISEILHEMHSRSKSPSLPSIKKESPDSRNYDEDHYPHFLPSDEIRKYTIRVTLKGLSVKVWRKFECPSNISLRHLTELIIELMGWSNGHLNQIRAGQDTYYVPYYQSDDDSDNVWFEQYYQEEYKLSDVLREKGKTIRLEYDFGDSWMHEIRLSSIADYQEGESHAITFKGGGGACPPEDCGGTYGYEELLELNAKRKARKRLSSEEKERLEWYGIYKDYDPEFLDEDDCIDTCDYYSEDDEADETADETPQETDGVRLLDNMDGWDNVSEDPLYDDVMSLAFAVRELEPWEDLDDSDLYAVRMQDGTEIYIVTLGNGGESFDVQFYDGPENFRSYFTLLEGHTWPHHELMEAQYWANYVDLMFQDDKDGILTPQQIHYVEKWAESHGHKLEPEHGFPLLQHLRPHYSPSTMITDTAGLSRIKEALEAVVWFSKLILDTEDLTQLGFKNRREYPSAKGGKVVPLVVKTSDGYKVERTNLPGRIDRYETVTLPASELQPLRFLQKGGTQYYRLAHIPGFVGSAEDPEHAYSPLIFLCIDKKTEHIGMVEPSDLSDTIERDAMRQLVWKIQQDGILPQRIIVDDARTEAFLKDFCAHLGIILELSRTRIAPLTRACQLMYEEV